MMVSKIMIAGKKAYQCDDCFLAYRNEKKAKECEKWCIENGSCNIKITKNAINKMEMGGRKDDN